MECGSRTAALHKRKAIAWNKIMSIHKPCYVIHTTLYSLRTGNRLLGTPVGIKRRKGDKGAEILNAKPRRSQRAQRVFGRRRERTPVGTKRRKGGKDAEILNATLQRLQRAQRVCEGRAYPGAGKGRGAHSRGRKRGYSNPARANSGGVRMTKTGKNSLAIEFGAGYDRTIQASRVIWRVCERNITCDDDANLPQTSG